MPHVTGRSGPRPIAIRRGAMCLGVAGLLIAAATAMSVGVAGAGPQRPTIAYASERGGPVRVHLLGATPGTGRVLQAAGLGMDVEPSWSRDGERLAISTSDASGQNFDIATLAANGSQRRRITQGPAWDEQPAWSPDGTWIAFASDRDGDLEIYLVHPDGSGLRQLTANACEDTEPSWSPDGSRIAFASRRGGAPHIWTMQANGKHKRRVLKKLASSPAWSPDGTTIAFVSDADGDEEIFTVGANGRGLKRLTENDGIADNEPAWSPDGTMLAFASDRDGDSDILEIRKDGSALHVLTGGVWTDTSPAWRP